MKKNILGTQKCPKLSIFFHQNMHKTKVLLYILKLNKNIRLYWKIEMPMLKIRKNRFLHCFGCTKMGKFLTFTKWNNFLVCYSYKLKKTSTYNIFAQYNEITIVNPKILPKFNNGYPKYFPKIFCFQCSQIYQNLK